MKSNIILIAGILIAGLAGYLLRGIVRNQGGFIDRYQFCMHQCNEENLENNNKIYTDFEVCIQLAEDKYRAELVNCPAGNKQVMLACFDRLYDVFKNEKSECIQIRTEKLKDQQQTYQDCTKNCKLPDFKKAE